MAGYKEREESERSGRRERRDGVRRELVVGKGFERLRMGSGDI